MLSRGNNILALGLCAVTTSLVAAGPCDIYLAGGTPCIAAHGTTRALYSSYDGPLYQVKRDFDSTTADIVPLSAGGVANGTAQDAFCEDTTCLITIIYDQSGRGNDLTRAPPGGFRGPKSHGYDRLAVAHRAPVTLDGKKAYGVFVRPGTGYRNDHPNGTATGDEAEGMYAVLDGTKYSGGCCFDYGNAEDNDRDTGNGRMEAIYFGDNAQSGWGAGRGPWIMADLENGLFSGRSRGGHSADPSVSYRFVTAALKGGPDRWALRGGDATTGSLSTYYSGARPTQRGYNPMSKEGAIILGIGGDNSVRGRGTFYEGAMTKGYPSDRTEDLVQADIVAAKYSSALLMNKPSFITGLLALLSVLLII
ncbi:alpha-L-arabinofuranosidase B [Xylariomycetidae sp. FL2044]|nr:alpha-L-arabinofuranosidase B [Xylariomycetidae sp. FL2044]